MSLPTIEFPKESIKLKRIFNNEELINKIKHTTIEERTPEKIKDVYGELVLPYSSEERPYIFSSLVLSMDGKLGFEENTKSGLISKGNFLDPEGGLADLWMVNMLRTYADGVVFGSKTLEVEQNISGHIYDKELAKARMDILNKQMPIPWNIVISRNGKSIPLNHIIFNNPQIPIIIITSRQGYEYLSEEINNGYIVIGPYNSKDKIIELEILQRIKNRKDEIIIISTGEGSEVDTDLSLKILKLIGIERLLVETPSYMYHLMDNGLLDEAFINYSCLYAGGNLSLGKRYAFTNKNCPGLDLISIHIHAKNFIYTRQKLRYQHA